MNEHLHDGAEDAARGVISAWIVAATAVLALVMLLG